MINSRNLFFLSILFIIHSCVSISKSKKKDNIPVYFERGIIFELEKSAPLITNKFTVEIYYLETFEFIKKEEIEWNSISGINLGKGHYIIKTYVIYFGKKIWKTENKIDLFQSNVKHFTFEQPFFVTSEPHVTIY